MLRLNASVSVRIHMNDARPRQLDDKCRGARDSGAGPSTLWQKGKEAAPSRTIPELLRDQAAAHEARLRLLDQLIQVKTTEPLRVLGGLDPESFRLLVKR